MLKSCSLRLLLVVLALAICTGTVYAANTCPLIVTGNGSLVNGQLNVQLAYSPGFSGGLTVQVPVFTFPEINPTFTIDTIDSPTWLHVTSAAGTSPTTLTVTADAAAMALANVNTTLHPQFVLRINGDDPCPVTVDVLYQSTPVTMDSSSYLMKFTGSAVQKTATITVPTPVTGAAFTLDPSLPVPNWLTATLTSPASSSSPGTIVFDTTAGLSILKAMPPGNVTVPLRLLVTGCASCSVNFNVLLSVGTSQSSVLTVNGTSTGAASGTLVAASGTPIPIAWSSGNSTAAPVYVSGNPNTVDFTASCTFTKTNSNYAGSACYFTQGSAITHYNTITSLASTFPTAFNVNFDANLLDTSTHGAVFGDSVTVSVLVTPVVGTAVTLKYQFSLSYPTATLMSLSPTSIAVPPAGSLVTAVLSGTGFVPTAAQTGGHATRVYIGTPLALEPNGMVVNVVSSTSIIVSIPATLLQSGKVLLAVMNQPVSSTLPTAPTTSTFGITVTSNPVITAVTNAASYATPSDPTVLPVVSPFEVVSIFGTNFIPASGTGALPAGTTILVGTPDTTKYLFPTTLANVITVKTSSSTTVTTYNLKVAFTAVGTTTAVPAFLLFATPTQINALVPSTVVSGTKYNVTVSYGLSTGTATTSDAFVVKATTAHPGVFTADASGTGQGAIINSTSATMNQTSTPASAGNVISIYMTGLGAPNSTATSSTGTAGFPGSCLSSAAYSTAANLGTNVPIDGAVIQSIKLGAGKFAPCLQNTVGSNTIVTVTFACKTGGGSIAVDTTSAAAGTYAGFVADSVAGLYQVNVGVPAGLDPGDCPITVNLGNTPFNNTTPVSQPGVTVALSGS
jgi:uncharacterized protein (TIGR03437 family)